MNRKILVRVTAPTVIIGFLLFAACLVNAWYVNRLQSRLASILPEHISSMQAAQQLEIRIRQLRFHTLLYLLEPDSFLLQVIRRDEALFEEWLAKANDVAFTDPEQVLVARTKREFERYRRALSGLLEEVKKEGLRKDLPNPARMGALDNVVGPCREYARLNEEMIARISQESGEVSRRVHLTMLFLGLVGPVGGLLGGYGIARGLSRSIYQLSVRVQGMAQHLEKDVVSVKLVPESDLHLLDRQLEHVVERVVEVTKCLQRQQQEMLRAQQLAAVGQLAASVAHEIRNPLTAIKMLVEVGLRTHKPRPFTEENLRVIHAEILRLEQTVQGFLDFARPPELQRTSCDILSIIHQAIELVRARAEQQKVVIAINGPGRLAEGRVDRNQLCTVLINLLLNALDAMPGGGRLEANLEDLQEQGKTIQIKDTGEGIDPKIIDSLFVPFVSSKPTGSGLGLSICKRIVEEHGGTISAENRAEGGACFSISLPEHKNRARA